MTSETPTPTRRHDLDWLRIIAFSLLIFYHTGMLYVTWDFHVKSAYASGAIEPLMLLVNPWRLELLFFISGVAARFMIDRQGALPFAGSRFTRLFWPLVFGMFVIVPPQTYCQLLDHGWHGSLLDFYGKYATHYTGWCDAKGCLTVPTWNHLWYIAYLLTYCLLLAALWPLLKRLPLRGLEKLPAWAYSVVPFLLFWLLRATLMRRFGETHAFAGDWYVHANSFGFFLAGVAAAKFDRLFAIAEKGRFLFLVLGLAAYGLVMLAFRTNVFDSMSSIEWDIVGPSFKAAQAIFTLFALLGFARKHLAGADGPLRRTLTEAIFPFYIIHQTIIVVVGYILKQMQVPLAIEASTVLLATIVGCWLTYVVVRAVPPLRPVFGMRLNTGKA